MKLFAVPGHDRFRLLLRGFVRALFDPLITVVNPHWGVLSTAPSESPKVTLHISIGLPIIGPAKSIIFSIFYG
jgi:hypothetical protein